MKKTLIYLCLLLSFSTLVFSCKKNGSNPSPNGSRSLLGQWEETPKSSFSTHFTFFADGKFTMIVANDENSYYVKTNGNYTTKGDSLKLLATEQFTKQPSVADTIRTVVNFQIFEKATFKVSAKVLSIGYIGYPADGPVQTVSKYNYIP